MLTCYWWSLISSHKSCQLVHVHIYGANLIKTIDLQQKTLLFFCAQTWFLWNSSDLVLFDAIFHTEDRGIAKQKASHLSMWSFLFVVFCVYCQNEFTILLN